MRAGWRKQRLGEIAELKGRIGWRGLTAKEYTKNGPLFLSVHGLNYGDYVDYRDAFHISQERYDESPEIMLREGDVLICKDGAGIGKAGIVGELSAQATINSSLLMIRSGTSVTPKYLYLCLLSPYFQNIVSTKLNGATTPHLYQRDISEFPIFLPPVEEQHRIVAILDEAFDGIATAKANAEKNLQNARALFESHLSSVFARAQNEVCLSQVATDVSDGDHSAPPKSPTGVPFITISNINKKTRQVDFTDTFTVPESYFAKLKANRKPMRGDVLYTVTGSFGIPVLVDHDKHFCFQRHIGLVRPNSQTDSVWLNYALQSPQSFSQANSGATGTAQKTVSLSVLRNMKVPSVPLKAQRTIAAKLSELESQTQHLESLYQQKLAGLDELKKSLLHQAFSGEL